MGVAIRKSETAYGIPHLELKIIGQFTGSGPSLEQSSLDSTLSLRTAKLFIDAFAQNKP